MFRRTTTTAAFAASLTFAFLTTAASETGSTPVESRRAPGLGQQDDAVGGAGSPAPLGGPTGNRYQAPGGLGQSLGDFSPLGQTGNREAPGGIGQGNGQLDGPLGDRPFKAADQPGLGQDDGIRKDASKAQGPSGDAPRIGDDEADAPGWRNVTRVTGDYHPADVDHNGLIDMYDVFALVEQWGDCRGCTGDVNGNGFVDYDDLYIVLRFIGVDIQPEAGGSVDDAKTPKGKAERGSDGSSVGG